MGLIEERVGQGVLPKLTRVYRSWLMVWIYLDLLALRYQYGGMLTGLPQRKVRLGRLIIDFQPASDKLTMTVED